MIEKFLRRLPPFKGKQRIIKYLYRDLISKAKDLIIYGGYDCQYKVPNLKENIGFELFANGIYEKETICFIVNRLPANSIFVDIGANIGAIALPVCKQRSDIQALAIEASSNVFNYLKFNFENNKVNNCRLLNNAVSEKAGELVNFFSPDEKYGKGSMAAVFTDKSEPVETVTLESLLNKFEFDKIDLIKIDVEGFEYLVFKGGESILNSDNAPDILFEFVDWAEKLANGRKPGDAQELLIQFGYLLWEFESNGKLTPIKSPVSQGSIMIFATKKK